MIRLCHGDANDLVAGVELGGVDEAVDAGRVRQVVLQVLERALRSAWEPQRRTLTRALLFLKRKHHSDEAGMARGAWLACAHLAGDDGLHEESEHGEHGEAAVLDLLHLQ
jgi:hypothetical protein